MSLPAGSRAPPWRRLRRARLHRCRSVGRARRSASLPGAGLPVGSAVWLGSAWVRAAMSPGGRYEKTSIADPTSATRTTADRPRRGRRRGTCLRIKSRAGRSALGYVQIRTYVLSSARVPSGFAELHCHSNFSFLDGASTVDDLVERAVELGLTALAVTDHQGLYGAVRFATRGPGGGPAPDRRHGGRAARPGRAGSGWTDRPATPAEAVGRAPEGQSELRRGLMDGPPTDGRAVKPPVERLRPPGHREPRREDLRGVRARELGPHLVLLARDMTGYRSLCRLASHAHLAGTKGAPRFTHELLRPRHGRAGGAVGLPPRRDRAAAAGRRPGRGDADAARRWRRCSRERGSTSSCSTTCCPTTTGSSPRRVALAARPGCRSS